MIHFDIEKAAGQKQRFKDVYIDINEVAETVGVSRMAVQHYINKGSFPQPIQTSSNGISFWEREVVKDVMAVWKVARNAKM